MNSDDPTVRIPPPEPPIGGIGGLDAGELLARGLNTVQPSHGAGAWVPPAPEDLARLLPQYHIESLLGAGGMGAVYKGRQAALDRPVAIKLLPAEIAADPQFVARFQREARTLAKLQHPGIVTVYDFGQTSAGHLYFVMEFVDGTDLHRILHAPGGVNPAQALELISQICDALHYAHEKGVIHRDIKPGNILVNTQSRAKLADFGLARPVKEESAMLTASNVIMGTAAYMAPEQHEGHSDQRADIYALGVMLYEMLCGQRPGGAFDPPSHRVQVDVRLDGVVLKALQQAPERRYRATVAADTRASTSEGSRGNRDPAGGTPALLGNITSATATKDAPFVNSLGMKFVPVAGTKVLFSIWETRVRDYAVFAKAKTVGDAWTKQEKDGVPVGREPDHPVVGVNWDDSRRFCAWLTEKEAAEGALAKGAKYRLPSDEEWSWAVGLPPEVGTTPAEKHGKNDVDFPWGKEWPPMKKVGNYADESFHAKFPVKRNEKENRDEDVWMKDYTDGFATTSPVGSFPANAYGLYDLGGNVWQWCEDWWNAEHKDRVLRGASWQHSARGSLRSSNRYHNAPAFRYFSHSFRCVLEPAPSPTAAAP